MTFQIQTASEFYRNGKVMDAATVLDLKKQLCQEA